MSIIERIRAYPPAGQLALAGATALALVVALALAYLAMRPKYEVLFRDLRPADAATIVAELEKNNIPFSLDDGGATILAPASQIDQTRLAIMGADLPLKGTVGFELFNKSDMGLTEFAQRINYQRALQGELARTIMTIDAIDTARVHLTLPEPSIFRADRKPAKASVTLTTRPGRTLAPDTVIGVQRLVGASVPELDVRDVVVLDARGSLVAGGQPIAESTDGASAAVQQTRAIEQYYAASLRRTLAPLYPSVRVEVLVPVNQWGGVDANSLREEALAQWTPNDRDFHIQVSVSAPAAFTPSQQDDIGRIVGGVTGWSAERGDTLVFPAWSVGAVVTDPASGSEPLVSTTAEGTMALPQPTPGRDLSVFAWAAGVVVAIAGLVLFLNRRPAPPKTLTEDQREAYVRRLRRLLAEDAGHAG